MRIFQILQSIHQIPKLILPKFCMELIAHTINCIAPIHMQIFLFLPIQKFLLVMWLLQACNIQVLYLLHCE